jgi:hypothetical protein
MKRLRLLIATLLISASAVFGQTVTPTNMVATYNAALSFLATLSTSQSNSVIYAHTLTNSMAWSNLPLGAATRNGLEFSSLTSAQIAAALNVATNALGTNGTLSGSWLFDQIRKADAILSANGGGNSYGSNVYFIAFVGAPSTTQPWMVQFGGHHIAYNISFNTTNYSATPFFIGVEPKVWTNSDNSIFAPLTNKFAAVVTLRSTLTSSALLSGTYSDVVFGANGNGNHDNYPQSYPTTGRGVSCTNLSASQIQLVKNVIAAWVTNVSPAVASQLLPVYDSDLAMSQTYVGYTGSDATMQTASSYLRIDGPRVWIEFICQNGIVFNAIHYHTIWRDKLSDYGSEYGVCTTNIPVTISTQPTNTTASTSGSAALTVAVSGTAPFVYQWYKDSVAIDGATNAIYSIPSVTSTNAGTYYVSVLNNVGLATSTNAVLTVSSSSGNTAPTLAAIANYTINPGYQLVITNTATDSDVPAQTLTFSLPVAPTNATIDPSSGVLAWRPLIAQAGSENAFSVTVTDNGSPSMSATQSFSVVVQPVTVPTNSAVSYSDGVFQFEVSGLVGPDYIIQTSSNLTDWESLYTNNPVAMPFQWTDSSASNSTARFYRILLGP